MKQDALVVAGPHGRIEVPGAAIAAAVAHAVALEPGVHARRPRRGLRVEVGGGRVSVRVDIATRRGDPLPALGAAVQERVATVLRGMLGLEVAAVDVSIEEIAT